MPPSLLKLLAWEQTLNDRVENLEAFNSINADNGLKPEFMPERRPVFHIKTAELPLDKVEIIGEGPIPRQLLFSKSGKNFIRFFIHPESESLFRQSLGSYNWEKKYLATPTSSHRSLVVWEPETGQAPLGVKVSLNVSIGKLVRVVTRNHVKQAVMISALLKSQAASLQERGIRFLEEPAGVVSKDSGLGYLLRSYPEDVPGSPELVPMFSLYARPVRGPPLVVKMARTSGKPAKEFVAEHFIEPLVRQYAYMLFGQGLSLEPHEQNVLLEVESEQPTKRFWYRDLGGIWTDVRFARAAGKELGISSTPRDPIATAIHYLRDSNFYALRFALEPYYPEITKSWIEKTFQAALARAVKEWTGIKASSFPAMRSALDSYLTNRTF